MVRHLSTNVQPIYIIHDDDLYVIHPDCIELYYDNRPGQPRIIQYDQLPNAVQSRLIDNPNYERII